MFKRIELTEKFALGATYQLVSDLPEILCRQEISVVSDDNTVTCRVSGVTIVATRAVQRDCTESVSISIEMTFKNGQEMALTAKIGAGNKLSISAVLAGGDREEKLDFEVTDEAYKELVSTRLNIVADLMLNPEKDLIQELKEWAETFMIPV